MKLTRKKRREAKLRAAKRIFAIEIQKPRAQSFMMRPSGITYIQLGDGFEFIIDRAHERIVHMMKLSATSIYDMVEKEWVKYRSTMYKVGDQLHCKFIPRKEDRSLDLTDVPRLTYEDLVTLGYMYDAGEDSMARFRFDYIEYKRRRYRANIIFDDVVGHENEIGTILQ